MAAASDRVVTVFGGTGFLGRLIVRHLRLHDFDVRVASRHPDRGHALLRPDDPHVRSIKVDVHDERSVADALADAYGAVNAISLYVEQGRETFQSVHVESAQRVAAQAQRAGVKRLIHISGIGANPRSQSLYIRKRGEGELAVRAAFADAILVRPAAMFGPDDGFLITILKLLNRLPIYPMFSNGQMRLQPVYVEDVGQAIAKAVRRSAPKGISIHRHCAKSEKLGLSGSNGDGHPTSALPSAATRVGAIAKAPSDIVELWAMHARKQFEMLSEQTKELTALAQKMAGESAEPITRRKPLETSVGPRRTHFLGVSFPAPQHVGFCLARKKGRPLPKATYTGPSSIVSPRGRRASGHSPRPRSLAEPAAEAPLLLDPRTAASAIWCAHPEIQAHRDARPTCPG
jgi:uncharacterized protein YbjT (DUF2867 family)